MEVVAEPYICRCALEVENDNGDGGRQIFWENGDGGSGWKRGGDSGQQGSAKDSEGGRWDGMMER